MSQSEPPSDEGQPGWVKLPDGRTAYRYPGSDELIIPETGQSNGGQLNDGQR
ncbi:hypothetical protein [Rhodococcus sp. NPDC127528]|uniref:hypothetical protein n=1 Tax=unclassified Rhodococcus (in: high G+C Gram-positive bacteria) TaxID=192944 RepID=UPI00363F40BF